MAMMAQQARFVSGGGFELGFELRVEFAVDQDEGDEAGRIGAIAPGMIGAALHDFSSTSSSSSSMVISPDRISA
jgi:hypothetical protein